VRAAWAGPAVIAVALTGYLAWGAWVSAADPRWLTLTGAWWREWLRPGDNALLLAGTGLWLAALACFWWPRRLQPRTVGLVTVVVMVLIGGVLTGSALTPCRGRQTESAVLSWMLDLYVGNPPSYPLGACHQPPPLAYQFGGPVSLLATLTGALAAAAVLWRQPVDRLRARLVRDATVLTGLDTITMPLLWRLSQTRRRGSIVVIEPDAGHPLLAEARATGARVMVADPASPRVLLPVVAAAGRNCALSYLYALRQDAAENEAILAAAGGILRRYRPDPQRQPHLVARIDDPRHADHWRGRHSGTSSLWFEDALSPLESTACALVNQVFSIHARQLILCGDSTLALALLLELARRAWERRGLADAAALGSAAGPQAGWLDEAGLEALAAGPVRQVILLDQRAEDLRREYHATAPDQIAAAAPEVRAEPVPWRDRLLAKLDDMPPPRAAQTAVVVADSQAAESMHAAGRVARLHPGIALFVLTSDGAGASKPIFGRLQPVQRTLLVDGEAPEDTWTRVARHWHECYRMRHPAPPGDPRAAARRPWADLDDFIRQDNILQLRSVMTAVVARGRQWVPARAVPEGSFIELTERDVEAVATAEHERWYRRRLGAGWSAGGPNGRAGGPNGRAGLNGRAGGRAAGSGGARTNARVVPWPDLPAAERGRSIDYLRSQLDQLEDVGFMPIVPAGGPAHAAEFGRVGTVRARRLQARRRWTRRPGDELHGDAGDWRVVDDAGEERTVRDPEFRRSHQLIDADRWRRTGTVRAWRVGEVHVLRTIEGKAVAEPGDWVVEGGHGERWPVTDEVFRRGYVASAGLVG
jgi:hypothetical protein